MVERQDALNLHLYGLLCAKGNHHKYDESLTEVAMDMLQVAQSIVDLAQQFEDGCTCSPYVPTARRHCKQKKKKDSLLVKSLKNRAVKLPNDDNN